MSDGMIIYEHLRLDEEIYIPAGYHWGVVYEGRGPAMELDYHFVRLDREGWSI